VRVLALLCLLGSGRPQRPNLDNRKHDVYIAGFFPFGKGVEHSDTGQWLRPARPISRAFCTGRGVMPSVKLALDHVNEHSILTNYRLHMWWNDTMVSARGCRAGVGAGWGREDSCGGFCHYQVRSLRSQPGPVRGLLDGRWRARYPSIYSVFTPEVNRQMYLPDMNVS
jgi:hypothetical protein